MSSWLIDCVFIFSSCVPCPSIRIAFSIIHTSIMSLDPHGWFMCNNKCTFCNVYIVVYVWHGITHSIGVSGAVLMGGLEVLRINARKQLIHKYECISSQYINKSMSLIDTSSKTIIILFLNFFIHPFLFLLLNCFQLISQFYFFFPCFSQFLFLLYICWLDAKKTK